MKLLSQFIIECQTALAEFGDMPVLCEDEHIGDLEDAKVMVDHKVVNDAESKAKGYTSKAFLVIGENE